MTEQFTFDVFLSYSSKDKAVVRAIAERLWADRLHVWLDDWEIRPGDSIPAKVEAGLEHSRVLVLCMSANAFGSEWAQLESGTFRFRDPLNRERRFIPLRLDDAPIRGSLAQFLYINWLPANREQEYPKLLEACRFPARSLEVEVGTASVAETVIQLDYNEKVRAYAFSPDGKSLLSGGPDQTIRQWDTETGRCLRILGGAAGGVRSIAWDADQTCIVSGSDDGVVRVWHLGLRSGGCIGVFDAHEGRVCAVTFSGDADQLCVVSGYEDGVLRMWDVETGRCLRARHLHYRAIRCIALSPDQHHALTAADDATIRQWALKTGDCLRVFEGHGAPVHTVALSTNQHHLLSGSDDETVRLWDLETGGCLRVLEGHTKGVISVAWNSDQRHALSGSPDKTVRLWDLETGRCLRVLEGHANQVIAVAWSADQRYAFSGDEKGGIRVWNLSEFITATRAPQVPTPASALAPDQVQYTNAKVLLVGDTSAGKTGLSMRLAHNKWEPSDSTVGAWATHWKLPVSSADGVEREVWLWDFGGQADQRLIHQLYMEDTALAVLVFDGQKESLFETLGQWDRDLTRASRKAFTKLLVAGRVDAGGLRVSRSQIETFVEERGFSCFLETSAKQNIGCRELRDAILAGIRWADIPWRSSPRLFKRLKEEIIRLKDEGRVLMRFNELRDALRLRLAGEDAAFKDEELKAVVDLLAGPGVVWELKFGSWVLLQPERINAYAQAVIQTLRADKFERGCLVEERILRGDLTYQSSMQRLEVEEERFVLLAMHQTLVERGLCLREHTDQGPLLIFPSYYRRERPKIAEHPAVLVSYCFNGFLDDIYATLVVRLHHTKPFEQDRLWRYAADFKTLTSRQLGVKLTRRAEGAGELEVYFDPAIPLEEKIIFSRYVHEHLLQKAQDVVRLRHYVCPDCGTPIGNREVAMRRLEKWLEKNAPSQTAGESEGPTIICQECEHRVPLWDELERFFASPEIRQRVLELQAQSAFVLDNESKERALVGEVISTVALAGQISREFTVSDHGIDMEIEFKDDALEATGQKLYLQLKSGDSYLRERKSDGAEIFVIKNERHARYWMGQKFPVLLVIRTSDGEVRWMEVRDWLKQATENGRKPVKQIVFEGERFDVMSVRRWRDRMLAGGSP